VKTRERVSNLSTVKNPYPLGQEEGQNPYGGANLSEMQ